MDRAAAQEMVQFQWGDIVREGLGCDVRIDDARTEEYDWGWVFYFLPRRLEECTRRVKMEAYAIERVHGKSTPVGTKGLCFAVKGILPPPGPASAVG